MDINTLRALATPIAFVAFIGIAIWAFSKGRKKDFDEAANLPFADDENEKADDETDKKAHSDSSVEKKDE